jgi:hypothetical protein
LKEVTTKQFAEMSGLSPGTVSNALNRPGGKLVEAKLGRGRIQIDHPAARAYLESAARLAAGYAAGRKKRGRGSPNHGKEPVTTEEVQAILETLPVDIRDVGELTVNEVVKRHGTAAAFVEFLKAVEKIERIHKVKLENALDEGTVVSRDLVQRGVLEPFDLCFQRLLADGARAIATRVADMARAGESNEACEAFVSERLTDFIKGTKATAGRALEGGGG